MGGYVQPFQGWAFCCLSTQGAAALALGCVVKPLRGINSTLFSIQGQNVEIIFIFRVPSFVRLGMYLKSKAP
jgi:hypothetical protein